MTARVTGDCRCATVPALATPAGMASTFSVGVGEAFPVNVAALDFTVVVASATSTSCVNGPAASSSLTRRASASFCCVSPSF